MVRDVSDFKAAPWRNIDRVEMEHAMSVPTMLSKREQKLYYWLTSHWTQDIGAVVDLGCFVGGSTARLADGHVDAGKRHWIHAYDRFKADDRTKAQELYRKGIPPFDGTDIYWLARDLLEPWEDRVTLHRGDILTKTWDGSPIELLVMDAAKSTETADGIAERFFPYLIPGQSLVVQQDYFHWRLPWIPVQMHLMQDWFRPVAFCPDDTVIFQNIRQINEAALTAGKVSGLDDDALHDHLTEVQPLARSWRKKQRIYRMKRAIRANPGVRTGYRMVDPDK
ncbi:class I SAM-dependent methyltransferase [Aliiroseovarius sp. S2029]|uniref:class I SAM-dependent methyltransferase n=1 Tax=Aliiroseovarius sp. S2029 TaxID=2936988 RepID=UPI0020C0507E|nr:class I SAM-dependent methyltransferase [Aliiroseovarius sp. S2029]MCK8485468.1 class I SAM-dependent methyltransferase [Aliiroseovarius sp. S2029]